MKVKAVCAIITAILFLIQGALLQFKLVENYAMFIVTGVFFLVCFILLIRK